MVMYRALIRSNGTILESDSFKCVFRAAQNECRDCLDDDHPVSSCEIELIVYSMIPYVNEFGFNQYDIISRDHIAFLAVSEHGYTVETNHSIYDCDRLGSLNK